MPCRHEPWTCPRAASPTSSTATTCGGRDRIAAAARCRHRRAGPAPPARHGLPAGAGGRPGPDRAARRGARLPVDDPRDAGARARPHHDRGADDPRAGRYAGPRRRDRDAALAGALAGQADRRRERRHRSSRSCAGRRPVPTRSTASPAPPAPATGCRTCCASGWATGATGRSSTGCARGGRYEPYSHHRHPAADRREPDHAADPRHLFGAGGDDHGRHRADDERRADRRPVPLVRA